MISRKHILYWLVLMLIIIVVFHYITPYYARPEGPTPSPIDSRVIDSCKFFDKDYVIAAKESGYDIPHYYKSFFIVDLIFPVVYTLFLLSLLQIIRDKKIYPLLKFLAIAGFSFDYLEDITFAIFLGSPGNGLAPAVAFFTTIKSILVGINMIVVIGIVVLLIARKLHKPKEFQ